MAYTPWGKEPQIAVAQRVCCARLVSCPHIVRGKAGYLRVAEKVGQWTSTDQRFGDDTEVQIVEEEEEAPPKHNLPTFRGGARAEGRRSPTVHPMVVV